MPGGAGFSMLQTVRHSQSQVESSADWLSGPPLTGSHNCTVTSPGQCWQCWSCSSDEETLPVLSALTHRLRPSRHSMTSLWTVLMLCCYMICISQFTRWCRSDKHQSCQHVSQSLISDSGEVWSEGGKNWNVISISREKFGVMNIISFKKRGDSEVTIACKSRVN